MSWNTTWYCGEMWSVLTFKTSRTSLEYCVLNPRNIPRRALDSQRGNFFPYCRVVSKTYTGYPQTYISFNLWRIYVPVNRSAGVIPRSLGRCLYIHVTWFIAIGHNVPSISFFQYRDACSNIEREHSDTYLMLRSSTTF